jgi:hypothetical protein
MKSLLASLLLIIFCSSSGAKTDNYPSHHKTGNDLYDQYKAWKKENGSSLDGWMYMGYVLGATDTLAKMGVLCWGDRRDNHIQIYLLVINYLENNPARRNENATDLIFLALASTFPCEKE